MFLRRLETGHPKHAAERERLFKHLAKCVVKASGSNQTTQLAAT